MKANDAIQRKQDIAASRVAKNNTLFRLLDELPEEFTKEDMRKAAKEKGLTADTARIYLRRMEDNEMVMTTKDGYKKLSR